MEIPEFFSSPEFSFKRRAPESSFQYTNENFLIKTDLEKALESNKPNMGMT